MKLVPIVLLTICVCAVTHAQILVGVTTDRPTYHYGDTVAITVTASNLTADSILLTFPSPCQSNYIIDGYSFMAHVGWATVMTYTRIPPHGTVNWSHLKYPPPGGNRMPLAAGSHTVIGEVPGYGTSDTCRFVVSPQTSLDSALGYLPLEAGNLWQYQMYRYDVSTATYPGILLGEIEEWVRGDTVLPNGIKYSLFVRGRYPDLIGRTLLIRIDSSTANVYERRGTGEQLIDSLNASAGDTVLHDWGYWCHSFTLDTILGVATTSKAFGRVSTANAHRYTFAFGFGKVFESDSYEFVLGQTTDTYRLVYARVGEKEYGTYVSVSESGSSPPATFALHQNYPNPFNPTTVISCQLPVASDVRLVLYDLLGREVDVLMEGRMEPGTHTATWDARGMASGVYFYRMTAGGFVHTRKLLLLR